MKILQKILMFLLRFNMNLLFFLSLLFKYLNSTLSLFNFRQNNYLCIKLYLFYFIVYFFIFWIGPVQRVRSVHPEPIFVSRKAKTVTAPGTYCGYLSFYFYYFFLLEIYIYFLFLFENHFYHFYYVYAS